MPLCSSRRRPCAAADSSCLRSGDALADYAMGELTPAPGRCAPQGASPHASRPVLELTAEAPAGCAWCTVA